MAREQLTRAIRMCYHARMATTYPGTTNWADYMAWRLANGHIVFYGPVTIADESTESLKLDYHLTGYSDKSGARVGIARYRQRIV